MTTFADRDAAPGGAVPVPPAAPVSPPAGPPAAAPLPVGPPSTPGSADSAPAGGPRAGVLDLERRLLWLSTAGADPSSAGDPAVTAGMATLAAVLFGEELTGADRLTVTPPAAPLLAAASRLLGMSAGAVGAPAASVPATLAARYFEDHLGTPPPGRRLVLLTEADLTGDVWALVGDPTVARLGELVWLVVRQSPHRLDAGGPAARPAALFAAAGWQVLALGASRWLSGLFERQAGTTLRRRLDQLSDGDYQNLLRLRGRELRRRLVGGDPAAAGVARLLDDLSDDDVAALLRDLGGHDVDLLAQTFRAIDRSRPTVLFVDTVPSWRLPTEGTPAGRASRFSAADRERLAAELGAPASVLSSPPAADSPAGRLLGAAAARLHRPSPPAAAGSATAPAASPAVGPKAPAATSPATAPEGSPATSPVTSTATPEASLATSPAAPSASSSAMSTVGAPDVVAPWPPTPTELGRRWSGLVSTRAAFGQVIADLGAAAPEAAARLVTVSASAAADRLLAGRIAATGRWSVTGGGRGGHLTLDADAAGLLPELVAELGRGGEVLPVGVLPDPAALASWPPGGASRALLVGIDEPITTASLAVAAPGLVAWQPAYAQDLEWVLLDVLGRPEGGSAYLQLSARALPQQAAPADEDRRRQVLAGAYRLHDGGPDAAVTLVGAGSVLGDVTVAADRLTELLGRPVSVVCLTSPDLVFRALSARRGLAPGPAEVLADAFPADRRAPLVTVHPGHPHALAFVAGVHGDPVSCLGDSGRPGYGTDPDTIVGATLDLLDEVGS